ncbi:MAG: hypothetical protein D8M59_00800 [Planctomycetes bacterium]|nr:hypothetical protein [Planctomycetota bacterium]NOG54740.1 tyrosine-type recombinase/integrase [Planctomycetota bacterium]
MATVYKPKGKRNWMIAWYEIEEGKRVRRTVSSGTADKRAAMELAGKYATDAAYKRHGFVDAATRRMAAYEKVPMDDHLQAYRESLEAKGNTAKHIKGTMRSVTTAVSDCGFETLGEIEPHKVTAHIRGLRDSGLSVRTCNKRLQAIKSFSRWLWRNGRTRTDALVSLSLDTAGERTDRRCERRAFDDTELAWLIRAAEKGKTRRGMSGPARAWLYRLAVQTGFRLSELGSLKVSSFNLHGDPPTVTVSAAYSKRRRDDVQPIRPDFADELADWLQDRPSDGPVFPLPDKPHVLFKADIRSARARWIRDTADRAERRRRRDSDTLRTVDAAGRRLDMHGLRHTFITRVVQSGASARVSMELARHSTPTLTIGRYAHAQLHDLTAALHTLPGTPAATGGQDRQATTQATGTA